MPLASEHAVGAIDKINTMSRCSRQFGGLCPTEISPKTGGFKNTKLTLGGLGDSYYEYLLKLVRRHGSSILLVI